MVILASVRQAPNPILIRVVVSCEALNRTVASLAALLLRIDTSESFSKDLKV